MKISYIKPITSVSAPYIMEKIHTADADIRRRKVTANITEPVSAVLFVMLAVFVGVNLLKTFGGKWYTAAAAFLPILDKLAGFLPEFMKKLPESVLNVSNSPALLSVLSALLIPPIICALLALAIRLVYSPKQDKPAEGLDDAGFAALLNSEAEKTARKAAFPVDHRWAGTATAVIGALSVVLVLAMLSKTGELTAENPNITLLMNTLFMVFAIISVTQLLASAAQWLCELLCGLKGKYDFSELIEDTRAYLIASDPLERKQQQERRETAAIRAMAGSASPELNGLSYALSLVCGENKTAILLHLLERKEAQYNELRTFLEPIDPKKLSQVLRELSDSDLVIGDRNSSPTIERFTLTKSGKELAETLSRLRRWGEERNPAAKPDTKPDEKQQ